MRTVRPEPFGATSTTSIVDGGITPTAITKLRKGMPVEIRVDALEAEAGAKPLRGELREIYPASNRQKAVILVRVAFKEKNPYLVPDMGAKVTFLGEPYPRDVLILRCPTRTLMPLSRRLSPCPWP